MLRAHPQFQLIRAMIAQQPGYLAQARVLRFSVAVCSC
jgi:hypothetical protein